MSTTKPPAKPSTYFIWGLLTMALMAALLIGIYIFTGGMVSSGDLKASQEKLETAQGQILRLKEENQKLIAENQALNREFESYQSSQSEEMEAVNRKLAEKQEQVRALGEQEEKIQFVARKTSMDLQVLAKQIYDLEGVQIKILDSGLLITGVASPFQLGSSRIEDDSLIPKLKDIAGILKAQRDKSGTRFYAAAVGNTDRTPVRSGSLWGSNLWLGAHRARTLADLMIDNGFAEEDVFLVSWGTVQAGDDVRDPESRRPEIFIVTSDFFQKSKTPPPAE